MPGPGADTLASVAETLAGLSAAARAGSLDDTALLTSLAAAHQVAAELERSELALFEAARDSGATWTRIAAATGVRNRQTAQKRHGPPPSPPQIPDASPRPRHPRRKSAGERGCSSEEHASARWRERPVSGPPAAYARADSMLLEGMIRSASAAAGSDSTWAICGRIARASRRWPGIAAAWRRR
jgi:hypothetical protein